MFLIDTVTLSELRRRERDPMVVKWFERQRTTDLFVSVISIGEIERGIARQRATDPGFADALAAWLDRVDPAELLARLRAADPAVVSAHRAAPPDDGGEDDTRLHRVVAPCTGVFYRSPTPSAHA